MNHLTIEQCRELKERGFPQNERPTIWWMRFDNNAPSKGVTEEFQLVIGEEAEFFRPDKGDIACPTLEELLEWLGDDFGGLGHNVYHITGRDTWTKISWSATKARWDGSYCEGKTPMEAVYDLAVAIKS